MLRSRGGFGDGSGSGAGDGGSSLSRVCFSARMRGDSRKRAAAIVSLNNATSTARSV